MHAKMGVSLRIEDFKHHTTRSKNLENKSVVVIIFDSIKNNTNSKINNIYMYKSFIL